MTRKDEIEQASLDYVNKLDISHDDNFGRNLCISLGQSYLQGAEWADRTMLDKVCEWLKENLPYSAKPPYQVIEDLRKAMNGGINYER